MTATVGLSPSYAEARTAFIDAASAAGADLTHVVHPRTGLDGEELAVEIASSGPSDADDVVLIVSGTHGVEGYCGSALQRRWLQYADASPPEGVAVVLVHALNPYGFSWVRRTNEDNVDLNRNFIDWTAGPPGTPGYDEIADLLVPAKWTDAERERTDTRLLEMLAEFGLPEFQQTISGGQFNWPDGVFYGGTGPVWSHRWLRDWASGRFAGVRRLAILDIHTGLGPWGHGELIGSDSADSPAHQRAVRWWGEVSSMVDGEGVSAQLVGDWLEAAPRMVPHAEVTAVAIEFGTVDPVTVLHALRADAWLHAHGDPTRDDAAAIRSEVRQAFADDDPAWFDAVSRRFDEVLEQTFAALAP